MCLDERKTDSRARPRAASFTLRRTVAVRRAVRSVNLDMARPLLLLPFLAEDVIVCVFHALALVRLRRAVTADLGSDLADFLLVDAGHDDFGRLRCGDRNAFRDREIYVVRKAELQLQAFALDCSAESDAGDLESFLEAFGHARHEVGNQRARRAPHRARALALAARFELDPGLVHRNRDIIVNNDLESALGPLHLDGLTFHVGSDASRNSNRFFADA